MAMEESLFALDCFFGLVKQAMSEFVKVDGYQSRSVTLIKKLKVQCDATVRISGF